MIVWQTHLEQVHNMLKPVEVRRQIPKHLSCSLFAIVATTLQSAFCPAGTSGSGCLIRIITQMGWSVANDGQAEHDVGDQGGHDERSGTWLSSWRCVVFRSKS